MMNYFVRLGVGILGSAFALLMYGSSITTFRRVIEKRSTDSFSGLPYAIALFNCLVYTLYGSPLISNGWDNVVVMVVNSIGLLLECCFACIYLTFATPKSKKNMVWMVAGVLVIFGAIAIISFSIVHDERHRKVLVGTVGLLATIILYASPLTVIKRVIQAKSAEFMPSFYFSLFAFLGSLLWLVYGALSKDIVIMTPNFIGVPLALGQMVLHCIYRDKRSKIVENAKVDIEKQLESIKENITEEMRSNTGNTKCCSDPNIEMQLNL